MNFSYRSGFVQRLWIACLMALIISLAAKSTYACTSTPPMPWFNENVTLLNTNRPSGILIKQDGHAVSLTNNLDSSSFYINSYNEIKELGKSAQFTSYGNVLSANGYFAKSLEPRNIIQDNRPKDVKLPEPQDTEVEIIFDQESYSLQFRISYELNKDYMPVTLLAIDSSCQGFFPFYFGINFPGPLLVVAVLILLFLIPIFIILLKQYKDPEK